MDRILSDVKCVLNVNIIHIYMALFMHNIMTQKKKSTRHKITTRAINRSETKKFLHFLKAPVEHSKTVYGEKCKLI